MVHNSNLTGFGEKVGSSGPPQLVCHDQMEIH